MDKLDQAGDLMGSSNVEQRYSQPGLYVGTSAFTAAGWQGSFYPRGMHSRDYLTHYAKTFRTVEVDSTFYATPSASTVTAWYEKTPADFVFAAKVPHIQAITRFDAGVHLGLCTCLLSLEVHRTSGNADLSNYKSFFSMGNSRMNLST